MICFVPLLVLSIFSASSSHIIKSSPVELGTAVNGPIVEDSEPAILLQPTSGSSPSGLKLKFPKLKVMKYRLLPLERDSPKPSAQSLTRVPVSPVLPEQISPVLGSSWHAGAVAGHPVVTEHISPVHSEPLQTGEVASHRVVPVTQPLVHVNPNKQAHPVHKTSSYSGPYYFLVRQNLRPHSGPSHQPSGLNSLSQVFILTGNNVLSVGRTPSTSNAGQITQVYLTSNNNDISVNKGTTGQDSTNCNKTIVTPEPTPANSSLQNESSSSTAEHTSQADSEKLIVVSTIVIAGSESSIDSWRNSTTSHVVSSGSASPVGTSVVNNSGAIISTIYPLTNATGVPTQQDNSTISPSNTATDQQDNSTISPSNTATDQQNNSTVTTANTMTVILAPQDISPSNNETESQTLQVASNGSDVADLPPAEGTPFEEAVQPSSSNQD